MNHELLKVPDAASVLRMSESFVYKHVAAGELPCLRLGRAIRFRREDLIAWLASQRSEQHQ